MLNSANCTVWKWASFFWLLKLSMLFCPLPLHCYIFRSLFHAIWLWASVQNLTCFTLLELCNRYLHVIIPLLDEKSFQTFAIYCGLALHHAKVGRVCLHIHTCTWTLLLRSLNCTLAFVYTVESRFYEPPRETKIGSKSRRVQKMGGKITVFDWDGGNDLWFELSGGSRNWGFEKSGFHCNIKITGILNHC